MLSAANDDQNNLKSSETLFLKNSAVLTIAQTRRLQAEECFLEAEKLAVLNNIIGLSNTNKQSKGNLALSSGSKARLPNRKARKNNRRDITHAEALTIDGIKYDLQNNEDQGMYADRFAKMINQLSIAISLWGRVMCFRIDLHTKLDGLYGEDLRRFIKSLNVRLKTAYKNKDKRYKFKCIGYCWACEVGIESKRRHYHLVIMVDGNLSQRHQMVSGIAQETWEQYAGQTAYIPHRPSYYIERTSHPNHRQQLLDVAYRMSYLAKVKDKGFIPKGKKEFDCSKLKAA